MRTLIHAVVLLFCVCLCGCETTGAQRENGISANSKIVYVHSYSKFSFPKQIEQFRFDHQVNYDSEGKDISVGYNSSTPIAATVYIYPAAKNFSLLPAPPLNQVTESLIAREFELRKSEISKSHPDARLISEHSFGIVQDDNHFNGKKATFSMQYKFGSFPTDSQSELYIFLIEPGTMFLTNDRQYVEYRITYPAALKDQSQREINSFLSELTWPVK
ncbi:MAG: hypothetical protein JWR19_3384 [Pedosphaera sp.]|nr:hypothetical protein [Pedosphaera sp.]